MILLNIIFKNEKFDIVNKIDLMNINFNKKDINIGISEAMERDIHFIEIITGENEDYARIKREVIKHVSKIILDIFIEQYCEEEITGIIERNYFFLKYEEMQIVSEKFYRVFVQDDVVSEDNLIYFVNKRNEILEKIAACIKENNEINIDGFFMFRTKDIRRNLEDVLNKIVERYMVEKEYEEFIKLLKYFVETQDSRIDKINLIVKEDDSCLILNEEGENIINDVMNDLTTSKYEGQIGFDDLVLSGLISYSPKKIVVYSNNTNINDNEMIGTIKNVFEEKVEFKHYKSIEDIVHPVKI
ncbi:putative sporulation protein YtxC [Clostridium sp. DL1XJH146]